MPSAITILHYVGADDDRGGVVSAIRALAGAQEFESVLGVNQGCVQRRSPPLPVLELPRVAGEQIGLRNVWRTRSAAREVQSWLQADPARIFHGHSRAGLLVALWLRHFGERRVLASVHVFGRQRWFYRLVERVLGPRVHWLGPAMAEYYRVPTNGPDGYLPDCIPADAVSHRVPRSRRPLTFGCAGSIVPAKHWELVLHALSRVPEDIPLRVLHAGAEDGSIAGRRYAQRLKSVGAELELSGRLQWLGGLDDMRPFYEEIDCLIVASPIEASSVAALEALGAGVPVLASDASGTRDLITACHGGWTFTNGSARALSERMINLATGPELSSWRRDDVGLSQFLAPTVARHHLEAYRRILNSDKNVSLELGASR